MEFDARQTSSEAFNSRSSLEAEKTLDQIRRENEDEKQKLIINNLNKYGVLSKELEEELQKLRLDDAQNLNWEKSRLEKTYAHLIQKGLISNQAAQLKIAKHLATESKRLNLEALDEINQRNIKDAQQVLKNNINSKKQELSQLRKLEKDSKKKSFSETSEEERKIRKQIFKDQLGITKEAQVQQQEIMDQVYEAGGTKQDAYKARLEANQYDLQAQAMTNMNKVLNSFVNGIKELLNSYIQEYSSYQGKVNARLQGSGSGWNSINDRLTNSVGATPYVKLSKLMENVSTAVEAGIAYNVEQRAFLQSIKEDIATTFEAFNANLLRIIRLQQNDSTAARLGLEADLTQLFNTYFSDTSYLSDAFDNVSSSLTEAIAQMTTQEGLAFEYQVQKWLGSLYSVGFSESTISNIASAVGMLGSGDVSGLANNSAMQNLIVMAASRVGLSYAEMLTEGLDADTTNKLLASMVEYLQEIATSDNKIIKSQYSQIFGLTTSDLVAAENLGSTISSLAQVSLNYSNAVNELYNQMNQLPSRLSVGEMTGNLIDNVKYTLAQGIASNPFTYALWEITDMIEGLSGGLQLPTISVLGNSFDLNTSLTNLARLGIAGVGLFSNIGSIINGVSNSFNPAGILTSLGVSTSANNTITRGGGLGRRQAVSNQVSSSVMIGNSASEDYESSLTAQANAKGEEALNIKKQEEQTKSINDIHEYLLQVFDPKITGITKMLGVISGSNVTEGKTWGDFTTSSDEVYNASTVKIENIGENNMANKNLDIMQSIDANVSAISTTVSAVVELLKGTLTVSVLNYGLGASNVPNWGTRNSEGNW